MPDPMGYALAMPMEALLPALRAFVAERDWSRFHDPKNLAMLLASEAGELLAEYRFIANDAADAASRDPALRARVAAEIGDVGMGAPVGNPVSGPRWRSCSRWRPRAARRRRTSRARASWRRRPAFSRARSRPTCRR
jgi:hypothetical protein